MTLIGLIIVLLIVGVILWGVSRLTVIDPVIKNVIYVVTVVVLLLWILSGFLGGDHIFNHRLW